MIFGNTYYWKTPIIYGTVHIKMALHVYIQWLVLCVGIYMGQLTQKWPFVLYKVIKMVGFKMAASSGMQSA